MSSLSASDALDTAILLFHQQLRGAIGEGEVNSYHLNTFLSALSALDPFRTGNNLECGFSWIADLLNSRYTDLERYQMASKVIEYLGKLAYNVYFGSANPDWVSSLVSFLSLGEQFYSTSTPYPGLLTFRILSWIRECYGPSPTILPVLTSTLSPAHPLRARSLALDIFNRSMNLWFSSQMENVPNDHLGGLLRAVGDPFHFPDLPLQDGQPVVTADYNPIHAAVILIGFASSDLWRNHLRRLNFASCEEELTTDEGRRDALRWVFDIAAYEWPEFLSTPAEIIAAIRCLEGLQCPNTAEVMILWAWTVGVAGVVGHDAWGSIERNTLDFYQTHGIRRLTTLSRHITDPIIDDFHFGFLAQRSQSLLCRVRGPLEAAWQRYDLEPFEVLRVARACQLIRLYQLFGYGPTTWKEAVAVEEVDEEMEAFSGRSVTPAQFADWACDYP